MEYILELDSDHLLSLPEDLVKDADLKPGSHFEAHLEGKKVIIEQLPFSSFEEGQLLESKLRDLQNK